VGPDEHLTRRGLVHPTSRDEGPPLVVERGERIVGDHRPGRSRQSQLGEHRRERDPSPFVPARDEAGRRLVGHGPRRMEPLEGCCPFSPPTARETFEREELRLGRLGLGARRAPCTSRRRLLRRASLFRRAETGRAVAKVAAWSTGGERRNGGEAAFALLVGGERPGGAGAGVSARRTRIRAARPARSACACRLSRRPRSRRPRALASWSETRRCHRR
jgi:hypothetical protein